MVNASKFEFIAGSLSLNFVDTMGSRGGTAIERLTGIEALNRWIKAAGLIVDVPTAGEADLERALALREAIFRAAIAVMTKCAPSLEDVACINAAALEPPLRPQFTRLGVRYVAPSPILAALSTIAADAIATLGRGERIRECPGCHMLFVDLSRPGRRRWCSSSMGCGNRAKVRTHRTRQSHKISAGE